MRTSTFLLRFGLLFAMIAVIFGVSVNMVGNTAAQSNDPITKVRFCHNPPGNPNKYNNLETSVNAFFNAGHPNHAGDIVPPFTYMKQGQLSSFEGMNWTEANQVIWENDCGDEPLVVLPLVVPDVIVTQASCENANTPSVVGVATQGLSYQVIPAPAPGIMVTVIATLDPFIAEWGDVGAEWTVEGSTATRSVSLDSVIDCRDEAVLALPTFTDAACGVAPALVLPANGSGVTYTMEGTVEPGGLVMVYATLDSDTYTWGDTTGWTATDDPDVLSRSYPISNPICPTVTSTPMQTPSPTATPSSTATPSPTATGTSTATATATVGVSELPKTGSGDGLDVSITILLAASVGLFSLIISAGVGAQRRRN